MLQPVTGTSARVLLGDPQHCFALSSWSRAELRLSADGIGRTLEEYEEAHGNDAVFRWERSLVLNQTQERTAHARLKAVNPSWERSASPQARAEYGRLAADEKRACHLALLRFLRRSNDIVKGRKVLTDSRTCKVLSAPLRQLVAAFITAEISAIAAMTKKIAEHAVYALACTVPNACPEDSSSVTFT